MNEIVQARRDRQRRQRAIEPPGIGFLGQQPGLQHGLGHLLDKQWHAICLGDDLAQNLLGQCLAMSETADQAGAGAATQTVHREPREMRGRAPWRAEFGAVRNQQQHPPIAEAIDHETEQLLRCRVDPVRIL